MWLHQACRVIAKQRTHLITITILKDAIIILLPREFSVCLHRLTSASAKKMRGFFIKEYTSIQIIAHHIELKSYPRRVSLILCIILLIYEYTSIQGLLTIEANTNHSDLWVQWSGNGGGECKTMIRSYDWKKKSSNMLDIVCML